MIATPSGSFTVLITPFIDFTLASFQPSGAAPCTGAWRAVAYTMPGSCTSIAYCAVPLTFGGMSRRGIALPMRRYWSLLFSSDLSTAGSGEGTLAKDAISP